LEFSPRIESILGNDTAKKLLNRKDAKGAKKVHARKYTGWTNSGVDEYMMAKVLE
jgi:hypothetical protein